MQPGDTEHPGAAAEHEFKFTPATNKASPARIGVAPAHVRVAGCRQGNADITALGIRRGDHVRFVNGNPFRGGSLDLTGPTETVTVTVTRADVSAPVVLRAVVPAERRDALAAAIALEADLESLAVRPVPGSPAARAGLVAGDVVKAINGKPVAAWEDLVTLVRDAAKTAPDEPITLAIVTATGIKTLEVKSKRDAALGFVPKLRPLRTMFQTDSFGAALTAGSVASFDFVKQIYITLKRLFTGDVSTKNLGGIITISRVSYAYAQEGLARLFYFLAILSINLAVINVLPIPVLDGGHLTFLLIERIKGSPVSTKVHNYSQILGLVFVLALMVYVTYNDILKLSFFS